MTWRSNVVCSSWFRRREVRVLGRWFVRVSYSVSLLVVDMVFSQGIVRVCGGDNDDVAS